MLKTRKNQKGFTLTELIIVIVIIGILAAVLIPTLSSYVTRAKKSAAEQNAYTMFQEWVGEHEDGEVLADLMVAEYYVKAGTYYVHISGGQVVSADTSTTDPSGKFAAAQLAFENLNTETGAGELEDLQAFKNLPDLKRYIALQKNTSTATDAPKYLANVVSNA